MKPSLFILLGSLLLTPAAVRADVTASRERIRFDDGWKFHLLDETTGVPPGTRTSGTPLGKWHWKLAENPMAETLEVTRPDFDDSAWTASQSTHSVINKDNTFAWFRTVLPAAAGPRPRLHFDGVDDNATVYLNGKQLAQHTGWDDPFDVLPGTAWKQDGPNVLAVLVENVSGAGGMDGIFLQDASSDAPAEAAASGPATAGYDDKSWRDVQLPHDFIIKGTFDPKADVSHGFLPKAAGWYRKTFNLPAGDKDRVLWLEFDGVYRDSIVWLNGHQLGRHASGYTSFYYDLGSAANYGAPNVLTVWTDARQNEGWWYEGGGIYRHVYLTKLAPLHIAHWGIQVEATPDNYLKNATVKISVTLANEGPKQAGVLQNTIIAPDGKTVYTGPRDGVEIAQGEQTIPANGVADAKGCGLADPQLWSPDSPALYTLRSTLYQDGKVVDELNTPFGIRSLRWDANEGFFLNGKPFKIQGTCNHQDFAGLGVALPDRVHEYKVEKLKEMGSNAFRFSHQPMAPELLDACDRLGMIVMDENRKLGDSAEILGQVESLVRRDRNHPSVIMWSMCNEERQQGSERGGQMFAAMKEVALKWDKSRPVTAAMNGGFGGGISQFDDLQGFNYNTKEYDGFHGKFPQMACYGSETASETTTRGIYEDEASLGYATSHKTVAESAWKPIAERPWMAGGFVWTGFDYRGEPTPYKWPCVNSHFGIMDTCGFPKDSYYYYLAEWGGKPVVHISQQWNRAGQEGQQIPVWVYGNAAKYELFLNGASLGAKDMPAHRHAEWKVAYAPGTLEARGYDAQGRTVATDKVETTGAATRLEIVPDRTVFAADGEDVIIARCNVLDAQGRVVPGADNAVTFSVTGPAHVAGVGNGNPSDHDPDKASQRHAFNGHCLVIIQSNGGTAGDVTLTANAPGLPAATVSLRAAAK